MPRATYPPSADPAFRKHWRHQRTTLRYRGGPFGRARRCLLSCCSCLWWGWKLAAVGVATRKCNPSSNMVDGVVATFSCKHLWRFRTLCRNEVQLGCTFSARFEFFFKDDHTEKNSEIFCAFEIFATLAVLFLWISCCSAF